MLRNKGNSIFIIIVFVLLLLAGALYFLGGEVKADRYIVRQEFFTGRMSAITKEGWFLKFGYVTEFKVADIIWFSSDLDGGSGDQSIRVRFNDGASANINGSVRFILPNDPAKLIRLRKQFGTFEAIKTELVMPVINEAIYLTASLMSSKESYTTKRNLFSDYAEDQASRGVYRTTTKDIVVVDPLSKEKISRTEIKILRDKDGNILRKHSTLEEYGIVLKNFVVKRIAYPENIIKQLDEQQQALMDVQKAKAMAQKADQEAITAEKEGLAKVAIAKAEQEVKKIKEVVEANKEKEVAILKAEKDLEVARLEKQASKEYKESKIMRAEADATAARMLIEADGALNKKLDTYEKIMKYWAEAYTKQRPTPDIVIGGKDGQGFSNSADVFMQYLSMKALKDLQLDLEVDKQKKNNFQRKKDTKKRESVIKKKLNQPKEY